MGPLFWAFLEAQVPEPRIETSDHGGLFGIQRDALGLGPIGCFGLGKAPINPMTIGITCLVSLRTDPSCVLTAIALAQLGNCDSQSGGMTSISAAPRGMSKVGASGAHLRKIHISSCLRLFCNTEQRLRV